MTNKRTQKKGSAASAAQKAADMAREAQQKRAAEDEMAREEGEEARRNEEESDGDGRESDHEEGAAGGSEKANCSFSAKKEERLVEFFSVNQAFYDKSHPNYQNKQQKDKLLDQLAKELNTTRKQIQGWFKNMRTSVGKLYKTKSGQATQPVTARKKWQLQNFAFLKAYIVPRTYTVETTPLEETGEQSEDEESLHSIPTRPASPSPSTSAATCNTKPPASKKSKINDLLMNFLTGPGPRRS